MGLFLGRDIRQGGDGAAKSIGPPLSLPDPRPCCCPLRAQLSGTLRDTSDHWPRDSLTAADDWPTSSLHPSPSSSVAGTPPHMDSLVFPFAFLSSSVAPPFVTGFLGLADHARPFWKLSKRANRDSGSVSIVGRVTKLHPPPTPCPLSSRAKIDA
jgi:hypothetical protein